MDSADFAWAVMAIRIQREVGGNLAELLLTVAETMIDRERLRRDVAALTAEGKISAIVLGFLPVGLGGRHVRGQPRATSDVLFNDDDRATSCSAPRVLLMVVGFAWMKKIIEIEI